MYLVELRPGREELYRSVDELAAAIRSGDVDAHSRIFHRATSKWISITLHPQFKAIVSKGDNELLPPGPRKQWTFLVEGHEQQEAPPEPSTPTPPPAPPWKALAGRRRPLALGIAGLLLILGIQLAFSGPRPPWTRSRATLATASATSRERPASSPDETRRSMVSLASTASVGEVGYPLPDEGPYGTGTAEPPQADSARAPVVPKAPTFRIKGLESQLVGAAGKSTAPSSVESLKTHYRATYDSAQGRIQARIDSIVSTVAKP